MRFSRHLTIPALLLAAACTLGVAHAAGSATEDPALVHARALLAKATLFDGHNDLPWAIRDDKTAHGMVSKYDLRTRAPGQTDIPRLRAGGVQAQFWSVYIPGEQQDGHFARTELEQIAIAREIIRTHGDVFTLAEFKVR
jgi:membrane dipeptidase